MKADIIRRNHEQFLYPVVRVHGQKAAGSGTVIYSKPRSGSADGEDYQTFVLTNHHVVEDCISHKKDWHPLLKRQVEKEILERPRVETFSYVRLSEVDSTNGYWSTIVAYDKDHDLALLLVDTPRRYDYPAKLIPRDKIGNIKLFMDVVVAGCSLSHEPFCNFGQVTYLKEYIEKKKYLMTNASSIFGNSGGALFLAETGEMIGVPSRISGIQIGFGVDIITWMGFAVHPERIYEFLDEQEMKFIFDPTDTYEAAIERRRKKETDALLALKAEIVKAEAEEKN